MKIFLRSYVDWCELKFDRPFQSQKYQKMKHENNIHPFYDPQLGLWLILKYFLCHQGALRIGRRSYFFLDFRSARGVGVFIWGIWGVGYYILLA